ncbi:hypothetical protein LOD99_3763 [Oopsacas minuta]|uniref:Mitochondrial ribosomal protein L27 n=1 Tax=Oopsacas minuta TaxID=111878 RepID=A0AAV7JW87_9METZ|nr:hypothetical protein LOD99_3763 [Oopsacas minuta]
MVLLALMRGFLRGKAKRGTITSKKGNRFFYKGRGVGSRGVHLSKGIYQIQPWRIYNFIVPDLTNCLFKPYVSSRTPIVKVDDVYSDDLTHLTRKEVNFDLNPLDDTVVTQGNN